MQSYEVLMPILMAIDLVGPAVLLVLLRRWTRRWTAAVPIWLVAAPLAAFLLTGGVAWLNAYLTWDGEQTNIGPDGVGMSYPDYLATTFLVCGVYGAGFAGVGAMMAVPPLVGWWLAHARSFARVMNRGVGVAPPT